MGSFRRRHCEPKKHPGRNPLPSSLRREEIIIEPAEDVAGCVRLEDEVTEVLEVKAAEFYVKRYVRRKYVRKEGEGIAIDINPTPNPMIISSSQGELFHYIRIITGLNMYNSLVTLEQTVSAQALFKERVLGNGIKPNDVKSALNSIAAFRKGSDSTVFKRLRDDYFESIAGAAADEDRKALDPPGESATLAAALESLEGALDNLDTMVEDAERLLDAARIGIAFSYTHSDDFEAAAQYLTERSEAIVACRQAADQRPLDEAALVESIDRLATPSTTSPFASLNDRLLEIEGWTGLPFNRFGDSLVVRVSTAVSYRGGSLFEVGFFNLPVDFVEAMERNEYIDWGGTRPYRSLRDWMHFEIDRTKFHNLLSLDPAIIENALND